MLRGGEKAAQIKAFGLLAGSLREVTEIAQIEVKPGMEAEFETGGRQTKPIFMRAKGCKGIALHRSIEKPARYRLIVQWETLENHTVDFRGSEDFKAWRACVAHCFATPPEVEHTNIVLS